MPLSKEAAISRKIQFICLFVLPGLLLTATQPGFAQSPPLNFGNNFFVTGDYIVAGAYGMTQKFATINGVSYAVGTINVPDQNNGVANPGITGPTSVPKGAQIVAALLYWQTVEKVGAPGSGQNGYFRPLLYKNSGGPAAPGYAISGTNVTGSKAVSWSSGGCGGTSTGKQLVTYRADVAGGLPNDLNGNPTPNGSFEIRLPSVGNSTPLTLGATLVVIYRIPSGAGGPNVPLNAIVIYDGDYAQSNAQLTMTQQLQGFYDADANTVSRLTHIVGSGQSNKFQAVYLYNGTNPPNPLNPLPSLYGNKLPAFPGWYGTWDNPTWTFTNATSPINQDSRNATTKVVPSMSNQGCVSWGAVIMSTTVKDPDNDGILYSWKTNQGYCDASLNNGVCSGPGDPAWVDLTGAAHNQQDVFLQYDYMCSTVTNGSCTTGGNDYSFDPRLATDPADGQTAVEKVVKSYANLNGSQSHHTPIVLHAIPGNAIKESQPNILCTDSDTDPSGPPGNLTCPFPNELGTVGFRYGLESIKNYSIQTQTGRIGECTLGTANCVPVFQPGKKDSYHYALFSGGVGVPNWFLFDKSLSSVKQTGNTVTFTTALPHGIKHFAGDNVCSSGRVTVLFAITNPNLNGTFCIKNVTASTFDITVPGSPTTSNFTYPANAEPYLGVADGKVTSMSGFSDVAGQNVVVALGYGGWGPANVPTSDGNKWQTKAGTLMHELGHNMGLTHGGTFYNNYKPQATPPVIDYTPTFEVNCKSNVQTSMSYMFQFDLLQVPNQTNAAGKPLMVVDYSEDGSAPTLTEGQTQGPGLLNLPYANTASFQLPTNNSGAPHCDGSPLAAGEKSLTYAQFSPTSDFFSSSATGFDINFNGSAIDVMHAHDEWTGTAGIGVGPSPGLDLQQISAIGTLSTSGAGGGHLSGGGGGGHLSGGGGGGHLSGGGGGGHLSGGGGSPSEFTHEAANSYPRPPRDLIIVQEHDSPRYIDLSWFEPTFGTVVTYNVKRSENGNTFHVIANVAPPTTSYTDKTDTCGNGPYSYEVTAEIKNDAGVSLESVPTNIVPAATEQPLTGCYTVSAVTYTGSAVQGSVVPITWTLKDDWYTTPPAPWASASSTNPVTNLTANTLVANGPRPGNCTASGPTIILLNGAPTAQSGASNFSVTQTGQFAFNWDTDGFCAGSYTFTLTLDSTQTQTTTSPLQLQIDVGDGDPHITTTSLPNWTAGVANSTTITQDGGVGTLTWSIASGSLPPGISLNASTDTLSATLSGTSCVPGSYTFTVKVTDSAGNSGTQTLTLPVLAAPVAQINQPLAPESSAPGAAGFALALNGTGFDTCSAVQWNGSALATTFNSARQLTAAIPASDVATSGTASISVTKTGSPSSNVDFFQITNPTTGVFLSQSNPVANTGLNPIGLIAGDFNADGKLDLAIANSGGSTVSILVGNGDGTFTVKPNLATGIVPYSLTAGDFNNDGKLDLAVTNFGASSTVSIFIGNGDGTFQPGVSYSVGSGPISVVTGDFNGDGKLDLAAANQTDHTVSILLGYGDGTFHLNVDYPAGTSDVAAVTTGDFNGDGKLDLALTNPSSDTVSVLLGNGDGTFQAAVTYATGNSGNHPIAVNAADFNGDGKLDLAVTNLNAKNVAILLGNGDGTFQSRVTYPTTTGASNGPSAMTTGDFNGDGKVDLAITDQNDNSVSILLGNGNGTFQSPQEFTTGNFAAGVAAGDFNGDGRLDVAVANHNDNTVSVMLQAPHVLLAPSALAFGNVATGTSSSASVVTLTNDGSAALTISNIAIGGANPGDFSQNNNCPMSPSTLAAGSNCTINVTFTPTQAGARSATLSITDNASGSPQMVNLTGSGFIAPPTNLTANAAAGSGSVALAWSASPSAVGGYNVYRSTVSGGGYAQIASVPTTNFTDTVPSGTYYYVVTAVDASANQSAYSNEAYATD